MRFLARYRDNGGTFDFVGFADPPLGEWFHLAVVYDGTDVRVYYNGVAASVVQGASAMVAPLDTNRGWLIGKVNHGAFGGAQYFDGRLDEVRFWNSPLTAGEVAASYNLAVISDAGGVDMASAVPGVEEVTSEDVLTFFISSVHNTAQGGDQNLCISPDQTVAEVDIEISPTNAFRPRKKLFTPRPSGSESWNEAASDTSAYDAATFDDVCATVHDVVYGLKSKTLHLFLNLVDADADAPLTGGDSTIVGKVGVNIHKQPLD